MSHDQGKQDLQEQTIPPLSTPKSVQPQELDPAVENAVAWAIAARKAKRRLLVCSSDQGLAKAIKCYLEDSEEFQVQLADGKQIDRTKLLSDCPQLVIYDCESLQRKEKSLAQQLRNEPGFELIPILFLIPREFSVTNIPGYRKEWDASLFKPFEPEELVSIARKLLKMSSLEEVDSQLGLILRGLVEPPKHVHLGSDKPVCKIELTPREKQVLKLIVEDLTDFEIAFRLDTKLRNVEKYFRRLLVKTGINSRDELIAAYRKGELPIA
ncbi:MAG: LuxR C-terminal-related transcriptional regulator [Xenococcaceae cyanobacterium]